MAGELINDITNEKHIRICVVNFIDGTCATIVTFYRADILSETDSYLVENGIVTNKYLDFNDPDSSYEKHFGKKTNWLTIIS